MALDPRADARGSSRPVTARASMERLFLGWRALHTADRDTARHAALGRFLRDASARWRARRSDADPRPVDLLAATGGDPHVAHAAMLAWWIDPRSGHGLGERPAAAALHGAGVSLEALGAVRGARRRGDTVLVVGRGRVAALTLNAAPEARVEGVDAATVRVIRAEVLARDVDALAREASPEAAGLLALWSRALRRTYLGAKTMSEWKGFSSDVSFLLEHWQEYLDLVAVREQADRELAALRQRVFAAVQARYPAHDGWDATLDEDWILLRRRAWPVPAEEWLAFVVVLTDLDSVLTDGGDGWWSALSLPTDGDFDGDTFSTLVRAKVDPVAWREHLANRWAGHALGRALPALRPGADVAEAIEQTALAEFARYVSLVPMMDQCLRDMG